MYVDKRYAHFFNQIGPHMETVRVNIVLEIASLFMFAF